MNDKLNHTRTHDDAIDPALESLLDEALAPRETPAGLADRIVARTEHRLPSRGRRRGVLGRIGFAPLWRVAAAVALVGALGAAMVAVLSTDQAGNGDAPRVAGHPHEPSAQPIVLTEAEQRELLAAFAATEGVDFESYWSHRLLAYSGEYAHPADEDAVWTGSDDPVDMLLDTYEVEWLGADGPRMFF